MRHLLFRAIEQLRRVRNGEMPTPEGTRLIGKINQFKKILEITEEGIECPECEGSGEIYTTSPSQCTVYRNDCCGGCFGEVECETCDGTGRIEK